MPRIPSRLTSPGASLQDPSLFINRELSWLAFNERVLALAWDDGHPLLERVKFLAIVGSNLDEFFMIRVAALHKQLRTDGERMSTDGLTTEQQLALVRARALQMLENQVRCWTDVLRPALDEHGIRFLDGKDYSPAVSAYLASYFEHEIAPVLTPLAVDPGHPFPHISNLSKNLAVVVKHDGRTKFARVKLSPTVPRFLTLPSELSGGGTVLVFLEDVVCANVQALFPGTAVRGAYVFRVVRDTDMVIQEDEADDLLETIDQGLRQLRHGTPSLLQVEARMPRRVMDILVENFDIDEGVLVRTAHRVGFGDWMELTRLHRPELKYPNFAPRVVWRPSDAEEIFELVRHRDFMLHHPFDSFSSVETFLRAAVDDPQVVAIKMTLYRIGHDSPLIDLLERAAESGKQVAVLVELKARFDEKNNITWATRLEAAGVHVVYGLVNLKTHCKLCLVVRKQPEGIRRYAHIGTGNYNAATARIYTDLGLVTARPADRAGRHQSVQLPHRLFQPDGIPAAGGGAGEPAPPAAGADRTRGRTRARRAPRAHRDQGQRPHRHGDHPAPVPRLAGRRADRPHRARHLLPAARRARRQRHDPGALNRRPVPRALADLFLRERSGARNLHRQRRPHGAEPRPACRGPLPGARPRADGVSAGRRARCVPAGHPACVRPGRGRRVPAAPRATASTASTHSSCS